MRSPSRFLLFAAVLAFILWGPESYAQSSARPFVTFQDFVSGVAAADSAVYRTGAEARVQDEPAFEEMRQHILSLYDGVKPTHSFLLDAHYIDCIPIEQQPSVRALGLKQIAAPPPAMQTPSHGRSGAGPLPLEMGLTDEFGNRVECEEGTIPMRRVTLEDVTRFKTLREFFQKGPDGAGQSPSVPPPSIQGHAHAYGYQQNINNIGGSVNLNLWDPSVNSVAGQIFSLSQLWYEGGSPVQTVESGWQVFPQMWNTNGAVLFIYWTADGYWSTGCYNLSCPGFVQTGHNVVLGAPNWTTYSVSGGNQAVFLLRWQFYQGNWWFYFNDDSGLVGYYPGTIFKNGQMSRYSTEQIFGGETVSTSSSWPPMGSGAYASSGYGYAAFQNLMVYLDLNGGPHWPNLTIGRDSTCYTSTFTPSSEILFFGGPAGNGC
jgi:hypothetical protein